MITRRLTNRILHSNKQKSLRLFGSKKREFGKRSNLPEYRPMEFEPFKLRSERNQLFEGYTMDELFARNYGEKHSNLVRKEMTKDNIIWVVGFMIILWLGYIRKDRIEEFEIAWMNYHEDIKED